MSTQGYEVVFSGSPAEVTEAAQRWVNVSSGKCRIFVRIKKGKAVAVVILIGKTPEGNKWGLEYVSAKEMGIKRQYKEPAHLR